MGGIIRKFNNVVDWLEFLEILFNGILVRLMEE